jgi:ABC-type uncharacterized transport system permease subunit
VLNLGVEGMMLIGAVIAVAVTLTTGNHLLAIVCAAIAQRRNEWMPAFRWSVLPIMRGVASGNFPAACASGWESRRPC